MGEGHPGHYCAIALIQLFHLAVIAIIRIKTQGGIIGDDRNLILWHIQQIISRRQRVNIKVPFLIV
ncbi:hypothetical protein D3C85_1623060 [compost metagenome]